GKAAVATLQAVNAETAALLDAGDLVDLQVQGNAVNVVNMSGEYIGMVEPRIGLRLSKMMEAGNQYSAALLATGDVRVMIRETFQAPAMIGRVSFPQAVRSNAEVRAYTRKGLLRGEDLDYGDDDEADDTEEEETGWHDDNADMDGTGVDVDIQQDDEGFD
nr:hypothetical protein [Tepidiformaceae bacterium]